MTFGDRCSYDKITRICGDDAQHRARNAILAAARRVLRDEGKLLVHVRGKGYIIAQPGAHAPVSLRFQGAARRRYLRAYQVLINSHLELMTPGERVQTITEPGRVIMKRGADRRVSRGTAGSPRVVVR